MGDDILIETSFLFRGGFEVIGLMNKINIIGSFSFVVVRFEVLKLGFVK